MRELSINESKHVSGSTINIVLNYDIYDYYPPAISYCPPSAICYEPVLNTYYAEIPVYNQWGRLVGFDIVENYYFSYEPVYCQGFC